MIKLFIGGIPGHIQELELVELFSLYGHVSSIKLIYDKKTGASMGYGFAEVEDLAAANRAVEGLNGLEIAGRTLNVKIQEEKPKPAAKPYKPKPAYPQKPSFQPRPAYQPKPSYQPRPDADTTSQKIQPADPGTARPKRPRKRI